MKKTVFAVVAALSFCPACITASLDAEIVARHAALARRAAAEGMVLLKNDGVLPLAAGSEVALFDLSEKYRPGGGGSSNVKPVRIQDVPGGLAEAGFKVDPESRETAILLLRRTSGEGKDNPAETFDLTAAELDALAGIKAAGFKKTANKGRETASRPARGFWTKASTKSLSGEASARRRKSHRSRFPGLLRWNPWHQTSRGPIGAAPEGGRNVFFYEPGVPLPCLAESRNREIRQSAD